LKRGSDLAVAPVAVVELLLQYRSRGVALPLTCAYRAA